MREIRTSGLMSGEGKRGDWPSLKLPRPSSTLPRISALEFQWVSRCRNQLQKWARYLMPRRGSRCFSFGRNFARESRFQATRTASACTFSWPKGRLPHFSAKFRRKCFLAFSVASGRNLPGGVVWRYVRFGEAALPHFAAKLGAFLPRPVVWLGLVENGNSN